MTAGEAKEPFKDVPVVMSFVYLVPLSLYPLTLMAVAANVNYTDPNLPVIWSPGSGSLEMSPFVIAVQTSAIHGVVKALQLFFIISAYTAANTELLKRLEERRILSRNDPLYISRMFKSRWQPLPAYVGIIGCTFVVIWSGVHPLYILISKGGLTSTEHLKSNFALGCDILGAYLGPFLFATFYLTYKYITPRSFSVDIRDLTPGDYVLGDLSVIEGEDPATVHGTSGVMSETEGTELEAQRRSAASPRDTGLEFELSPDLQEEYDMQQAREKERRRVEEILELRPQRMERRLLRELWSCVVAD
ncbi:hypothetical protein N0V90_006048 [Kalmusia sp. IMI 367209]|nr:hypothetical protein N0V90_006048 [Kalmusia sp. IMI 367209]